MSDSVSDSLPSVSSTGKRKLWLWPPALLLIVQWGVPAALTAIAPDSMATFFVGRLIVPLICALLLVVWWMLSRAVPFRDRLTVLVVYLLTGSIVGLLGRKSFPPVFLVMYAVPVVTTAWAVWLLVTQWMRWSTRLVGTMLAVGLSFLYFSLIRMDGVDGSFAPHFSWRWTPTAEDKLLSASADSAEGGAAASTTSEENTAEALTPRADDWLEFRGTTRDNRVMGVSIETDWSQSPPKELWRKPVGPGWSSFTVVDGRVYTQYQKGEDELVVCWDAESGASIWTFSDKSRFEESVAGAGPRATPTYHAGRLYVTGAAGRVHCLDAVTGKSYWSRDLIADGGRAMPEWGFASSPLVVDGLVIVFAGGPEGKSLIAYQAENGEPAWSAGEGSNSYSSAQLVTLAGQRQVLLATDAGLASFQPESGEVLWTHEWPSGGAARIVQPALVSDTDLLIGTGMGVGTRRIRVTQQENAWKTEEIWTTKRFKPYYNDFVVYEGHLYGFDGPIFMCVDVAEGQLRWRERGYGNGQVLLLADQGLLLILSEQGEIALLQANAERRQELSRVKAIEGKTWNHPVVAEGLLFVRNGEEAACYRLPIGPAADSVAHRNP